MTKEDLLLGYFSNSLSDSQLLEFENLVRTDNDFKEEFEFEKNIQRVVKHKQHTKHKAKLHAFEEELQSKNVKQTQVFEEYNSSSKPSFFWLKIAASVVLLLSAGWLSYNSFVKTSASSLFQDNYKIYPNTEYTITRGDSDDSIKRKAFVAYETENYEEAIKQFHLIESKEPYITFYLAQCNIKLKAYQNAKEQLIRVVKNNNTFVPESHWYLALIYLNEKDNQNAKVQLQKVVALGNYKRNAAKKLLEEL